MNRSLLVAFGLLLSSSLYSQKISISLFNELSLNTILVTPTQGSYKLVTGKEEIPLRTDQIIYLSKVGDSILVRDATSNLGTWSRVSIVGQTENDVIRSKDLDGAEKLFTIVNENADGTQTTLGSIGAEGPKNYLIHIFIRANGNIEVYAQSIDHPFQIQKVGEFAKQPAQQVSQSWFRETWVGEALNWLEGKVGTGGDVLTWKGIEGGNESRKGNGEQIEIGDIMSTMFNPNAKLDMTDLSNPLLMLIKTFGRMNQALSIGNDLNPDNKIDLGSNNNSEYKFNPKIDTFVRDTDDAADIPISKKDVPKYRERVKKYNENKEKK